MAPGAVPVRQAAQLALCQARARAALAISQSALPSCSGGPVAATAARPDPALSAPQVAFASSAAKPRSPGQ
eukprot:10512576-Alexandrium_andersonii.AAC.1